ncbi:MAG: O-antigen ligase family protein [Candidatus Yanofskybacteria bacterium]|nr:O-antigen ligase family protein [Candidatus Yanofskybacteria bacterium]
MREKLERIIFYLLIFTVPVQARVILHSWTRPFNQWTSAYLYGTDILLGVLFLFWLARVFKGSWRIPNFKFQISRSTSFWLVVLFVVSGVSIFNSRIIGLSFYQLLKLAEFIGFYFYLLHNLGKVFQFKTVLVIIIASGFFQSLIAIAQYITQGSVGLRLLGESPLSINTTGVAVFIADGERYLRAYGTAPHPNILAVWLFTAIFALYFLFLYRPSGGRDEKKITNFFQKYGLVLVYAVVLFAFFFTFSRVIIGLWALGVLARLLIVLFKKEFRQNQMLRRRIVTLFVISAVVSAAFSAVFWPQVSSRIHISAQDPAFSERVFYNKIAGSVATSHPLLGVGIGQFVPSFMSELKYLPSTAYQPVHNVYLLIVSEAGFIGLGAFILFLFFIFWRFIRQADFAKLHTFSFLIFTLSFLAIGLFDHFLWTSQQGSMIFWMVLALLNQAKSTL